MNYINMVVSFLSSNSGIIMLALSFFFGISKRVSTSKAIPIVRSVQAVFDLAANVLEGLGAICQQIASFLSNVLKSDGYLGMK